MLERHLRGGPAKIGVGANRAATAACFFEKYGFVNPSSIRTFFDQSFLHERVEARTISEKLGAVVLDDGMQVYSVAYNIQEVALLAKMIMRYSLSLCPIAFFKICSLVWLIALEFIS